MAKSFKLVIPSEKHRCRPGRPITLPGEQGVQGTQGQPGANAITYSAQANTGVKTGQPLYLLSNGTVNKAQADKITTSRVIGLAYADATPLTSVNYEPDGIIEQSNWTLVTKSNYLIPGLTYYLSPYSSGQLTALAPELEGHLIVKVGKALSTTRFEIEIEPPILL